jgi:hypothetical protein
MKSRLFKDRRKSVICYLKQTHFSRVGNKKIAKNLLISNVVSVFAVRVGMWQADSI